MAEEEVKERSRPVCNGLDEAGKVKHLRCYMTQDSDDDTLWRCEVCDPEWEESVVKAYYETPDEPLEPEDCWDYE